MKVDLDRLEALADAATPGPWEVNSQTAWSEVGDYTVYGIKDVDDATMTYDDAPAFAHTMGMEQADAEFIAETGPDVVKELIQQLREARAGQADAWDEGHGHCFHVENPAHQKPYNPYRRNDE